MIDSNTQELPELTITIKNKFLKLISNEILRKAFGFHLLLVLDTSFHSPLFVYVLKHE